jgi:signal transduction histidine kinase
MNEYKDKMLATVSHDLRTPLQGIMATIECAMSSQNINNCIKYCKRASKSAKGLLMLVNDLLDFSQFIKGKLRLSIEEVYVVNIIREVMKIIKFQTKRKGIMLLFEKEIPEKLMIMTDPNRLKQILFNLLGNALKFTTQGHIKIKASFTNVDQEKFVKIEVEDTGLGIKSENISKLFSMFGKLDQENKNINKEGVGLGLSICQTIIKILNKNEKNNDMKVVSTYGRGSSFSFCLPLTENNKLEANENDEPHIDPFPTNLHYQLKRKKYRH